MHDLINRNSSRLEFMMRLLDVLVLLAAGQFSGLLRFSEFLSGGEPIHSILLYFCSGLAFFMFSQFGLYSSWRGRSMLRMLAQLAMAWASVLLIGLFFSFLVHHVGNVSRLWLCYWFVCGLAFLSLSRVFLYSSLRYMRAKGLNNKRVVIVGYGDIGRSMHQRAAQHDWYGYNVKAIHALPEHAPHIQDPRVDLLESFQELHDYVTHQRIHEIWIALPLSATAQMQELQYILRNALVDIRWVPDTTSMHILSNKVIHFLGQPAFELNQPASGGALGIAKDLFDKLFALTALTMLLPLFVFLSIAIKLSSPGPVFFKQPRLGLNGRKFNVYKFRSMKPHAEHGTVTQATQHDPRITRIGSFIRRTSLDELPQFINVLKGEMSVVGPRPHALQHNEIYEGKLEMYMLRHRVKPGITGWAQIHGYRGETDTDDKMVKRVEFDLQYIQNWSLWMDMKIIVWTAFKGWSGKNAY